MSAVHKLQHSGEASGDGCVLKVCQKQICQSALPFSVSEVTPVTPSSLSIYCPPSAPLHTHTHTLYFLCGHLLFSILSPPFLLFIQHLICHTLTANLISFSSLSLPHSCCSPLLSLPVSCWLTLVFTASLAHLTSPLSLY